MANANYLDLTGHKVGRLTVIERSGSKVWFGDGTSKTRRRYSDAQWLVKCECGVEKLLASRHIRSGLSRSCGCLKIEILRKNASLAPGEGAKRRVLKYYRSAAKLRNLPWNISTESFYELTQKDCFYCGQIPSKISSTAVGSFTFNGIDRVDNNLGYSEGNVVACCETCNLAKRDMPMNMFTDWLKRAGQHLILKEAESVKSPAR